MIIETSNAITFEDLREKYGTRIYKAIVLNGKRGQKVTIRTLKTLAREGRIASFKIGPHEFIDLDQPFILPKRNIDIKAEPSSIYCLFRSSKITTEKEWELIAWYKAPPTIHDLTKTLRPDVKLKDYMDFIHEQLLLFKYVEIRGAFYRVERVPEKNPTHW